MPVFIDGYEIDVSTDETHSFDSSVTSDPVEDGSDITDNVKVLPDRVTLTGIVSDTPFGQLAERRTEGELNSTFALDLFRAFRDSREPVVLETDLRVYPSMVMERLSVPNNVSTGDAFQFTATFVEVRVISTERTTVRVEVPRAKRKVKKGNQKVADATPTAATTAAVKDQKTRGIFSNLKYELQDESILSGL